MVEYQSRYSFLRSFVICVPMRTRPFIEVPNRQSGSGLLLELDQLYSSNMSQAIKIVILSSRLEPHVALFQLHLLHLQSLHCDVVIETTMARSDEPKKSLVQAKASSRQPARMKSAAAVPEPRDLGGNGPGAVGELSKRRVNEGEKAVIPPFTVVVYSISDDSIPPPQQCRRRRYNEAERLQVAETRRRGACESCRTSRIKVC